MKNVESSNNDLLGRWELTRTDTDTSNHNYTGVILRAGDTLWQSTIAFWVQDICRDLLPRPEGFTLDMASRLHSVPRQPWLKNARLLPYLTSGAGRLLAKCQSNKTSTRDNNPHHDSTHSPGLCLPQEECKVRSLAPGEDRAGEEHPPRHQSPAGPLGWWTGRNMFHFICFL